jgi:hypothetical protein
MLAFLALLAILVSALPASGSQAPRAVAGSVTIVIHGQGRVTSDPAGAIDCPTTCSFAFAGSTTLTLRATPATGYAVAELASCTEVEVCAVPLNDFAYTINVYFRPRAKLQLWPNGDGAITVSPPPADFRGEPAPASCTPANAFEGTGCELYYLPGTSVTATAAVVAPSAFVGWSAQSCAGTDACGITLSRDSSSLVARFTPLEVRVIRGGNGTGSIVSEPPGIACPPTCTASFPAGSQVTLVASPDPASPFLSWKFGCTVSNSDPRRCTLTATNRPNWVGVALGEDDVIGVPTTLSVLFDVAREGKGAIKSKELNCGATCEHRYVFAGGAARHSGRRVALHAMERSLQYGGDVLAVHRAGHVGQSEVHGEPRAAASEREGDGEEVRSQADSAALRSPRCPGSTAAPPRRRYEASGRPPVCAQRGRECCRSRSAGDRQGRPLPPDDRGE